MIFIALLCALLCACRAGQGFLQLNRSSAVAAPAQEGLDLQDLPPAQAELRGRVGELLRDHIATVRAVVRKERRRGEEARALYLLEALWRQRDRGQRAAVMLDLLEPGPAQQAPWVDRQLGLEDNPPALHSSAAPGELARLAATLAGQGLLVPLLGEAKAYADAGEFIEAAGVMTLVQAVAQREGKAALLGGAWQSLARRRRCVAEVVDSARPAADQRLRAGRRIGSPEEQVALALEADVEGAYCAVVALQLLSARPEASLWASPATLAVLAPLLERTRFHRLSLVQSDYAPPPPLARGDIAAQRRAIEAGMERFLLGRLDRVRALLAYRSAEPRPGLAEARRAEVVTGVLLRAEPLPELGEFMASAFQRRHPAVASDPARYALYMSRLGPLFAVRALEALREPGEEVLGAVVEALMVLPEEQVRDILQVPLATRWPRVLPQEQSRINERLSVLRVLFRLPPMAGEPSEETRRLALDLHRCCRGDVASCEQRGLGSPRLCPVWTPLSYW